MKKRIIVVSAHPDDETLGVGGTLLKHKKNKDEIFWIIGTEMVESKIYSKQKIEIRNKEILEVSKRYNFKKIFRLNFQTSTLDSTKLTLLIPLISQIFKEVEPNIIYNLNPNDAHSDHKILSEAILANTKQFRHPYIESVFLYECISETEFSHNLSYKIFTPNYFVDISDFIEQKLDIMKIYKSELAKHPFPRSIKNIKALALHRGAMVNKKYVEAFQVLKIVN